MLRITADDFSINALRETVCVLEGAFSLTGKSLKTTKKYFKIHSV